MSKLKQFREPGYVPPDEEPDEEEVVQQREVVATWTGRMVAFDQTLGASGWVLFTVSPSGMEPIETGMVRSETNPNAGKTRDNLDRSSQVFTGFLAVLNRLRPIVVAFEQPFLGVPGMKMRNPESSLLAASALVNACVAYGDLAVPPEMIAPTSVRALLGLPKGSDKVDTGRAIKEIFPQLSILKPANEHTNDAAAIGYTAITKVKIHG